MQIILKQHWVSLLLLLLISIAYFAVRLPNLTLQPIFADEAIYIRWAQVMKAEPTMRFLPLSDGKTPLFMWMMMPLFKVFNDPLFAGRFLSVLSGFFTLAGTFFLARRFFNILVAFWSILLIALLPFMVFFDRLALADSMLAAFTIWSLYFALILINNLRYDLAMVLGYFVGLSWLTKTPGVFNVYLLPVVLINCSWSKVKWISQLINRGKYLLISGVIAEVMFNLLRLGPGFSNLTSRDQDYIYSLREVFQHPLDPFLPHLNDLIDWFIKFVSWPICLVLVLVPIMVIIRKNRTALVILLWALLPILVLTAALKVYTARYILFNIPPLIILVGWTIDNLIMNIKKNYLLSSIILALVLLPSLLIFDVTLLTNPQKVSLPPNERRGYFEDWTAGVGLKEIAQYLINKSESGTVIVGTEGIFGTLPDGLTIYLDQHSHQAPISEQVVVLGGPSEIPQNIWDYAGTHPTYFVANKSRMPYPPAGLKKISEYPKAVPKLAPQDAILFFQVLDQPRLK